MSSLFLLFACVAIATQQYGGPPNRSDHNMTTAHWMMTDHNATTSDLPVRRTDHHMKETMSSSTNDKLNTTSGQLERSISETLIMRSIPKTEHEGLIRSTQTQTSSQVSRLHPMYKRQVYLNRPLQPGVLAVKPTPSPVQTKFFKEQIQQLAPDVQVQLKGMYSRLGFTTEFQDVLMKELTRVKRPNSDGNNQRPFSHGGVSVGEGRLQNSDGIISQVNSQNMGRINTYRGTLGSGGAGSMDRDGAATLEKGGASTLRSGGAGTLERVGADTLDRGGADTLRRDRAGTPGTAGVGTMGSGGFNSKINDRTGFLGDQHQLNGRMAPEMDIDTGRRVNAEYVQLREQGKSSGASSQRSGTNSNVMSHIIKLNTGNQRQRDTSQVNTVSRSITLKEQIDALNHTARHYVIDQLKRSGNNQIFRATVERLYVDTVRNVGSRSEGPPVYTNTWSRRGQDSVGRTPDGVRLRSFEFSDKGDHGASTLSDKNRVGLGSLIHARLGVRNNVGASDIGGRVQLDVGVPALNRRLPLVGQQNNNMEYRRNVDNSPQGNPRQFENNWTSNDNPLLNGNIIHHTRVENISVNNVEQQAPGHQVSLVQRVEPVKKVQHNLYQIPKQQQMLEKSYSQQTAIQQGNQIEQPKQTLHQHQQQSVHIVSPATTASRSTVPPNATSIIPPAPTFPSSTTQQSSTTTQKQTSPIKPPSSLVEFFNTTITIPEHINSDPIMRSAFLQVIQRARDEEVARHKMATALVSQRYPSSNPTQVKVPEHVTSGIMTTTTTPSSNSSTSSLTIPPFYNKQVDLTPALFMTWSLPPTQVIALQGSPLSTILTSINSSRTNQGVQSSKVENFRSFLIQTMMTDPRSVIVVSGDVMSGAYHERLDHGPTILVKDLRGSFFTHEQSDWLKRAKRTVNRFNREDGIKIDDKRMERLKVDVGGSKKIKNFVLKSNHELQGTSVILNTSTRRQSLFPEVQTGKENMLVNQNFRLVCLTFSDVRVRAKCVTNLRRHYVKRSLLQCKKIKKNKDKMKCKRNVARKLSLVSIMSFQPMESRGMSPDSASNNQKTAGNGITTSRTINLTPKIRDKRQINEESFLIPVLRFAWMLPPGTYPRDPFNTMDYIMAKFNTSLHTRPRSELTKQASDTQNSQRPGVGGQTVGTTASGQDQNETSMTSPVIILDKLIEAANALSKLPGHSIDFLTSALGHTYGRPGSGGAGASNPLVKIISVLREQKLAEMTVANTPSLGIKTTAVPTSNLDSILTNTTPKPAVTTTTTTPKLSVVTTPLSYDMSRTPYDVNALMMMMSTKFQGIPDEVLRSLVVHLLKQLGSRDNTLSRDIHPSHDITKSQDNTQPHDFPHLNHNQIKDLNYIPITQASARALGCDAPGCLVREPMIINTSPLPRVTDLFNQNITPYSTDDKPTRQLIQLVTHTTPKSLPLAYIPLTPSPLTPHKTPDSTTPLPINPSHPTLQPSVLPTIPRPTTPPSIPTTPTQPNLQSTAPLTVTLKYTTKPTFFYSTSSLFPSKYVTMNLHFKGVSPTETTVFPTVPLTSSFVSAADKAAIMSFLLSINSRGVTKSPIVSSLGRQSTSSPMDQLKPKPVMEQPKPVVEQTRPVVEKPRPVFEQPRPIMEQPMPEVDIIGRVELSSVRPFTPSPLALTTEPIIHPLHMSPQPSRIILYPQLKDIDIQPQLMDIHTQSLLGKFHERQRKSEMPAPSLGSDLIQLVGSALSSILSSSPAHNLLQPTNHAHLANNALQAILSSNNNLTHVSGQGHIQRSDPSDPSGNTNIVQNPQAFDSGTRVRVHKGIDTNPKLSDLLQPIASHNRDGGHLDGQNSHNFDSLCPVHHKLVCGPSRPSQRLTGFCHQRCDVRTGECTSALCTCLCEDTRPMTSPRPYSPAALPFLGPLQSNGLLVSAVDPDLALLSTTTQMTATTGSAEQRLMRFLSLVDKVKAKKGEKTAEEPEPDR